MISDSRDRPGAPGAATVAVLAAFLVGVGAVGMSSVLSSATLRVLLAVVLIVVGVVVTRLANHPPAVVLGERVLRGIGTSLVVLGAYLLGLAMLTASAVASGPSPGVVVLLVYGTPAMALLAVATTTRMRVWAAGAGALVPMLAVLLLATAGVGAAPVSVTMLVAALLLAVVVLRAPTTSTWGDLASAAAAMSASFAFGAGASPFGFLGTTQLGGAVGESARAGLTAGAQAAVVGGALLVAVVVLVMAVLRHDLVAGVLVGSMFAMPPVLLQATSPIGDETRVVLAAVPALVVLLAIVALRSYRLRRALVSLPRPTRDAEAEGPSDATSAAACAVAVAAAAVVFVTLVMPVLGWDLRTQGSVAILALVAAGALAYWLPGTPGAAAAVVAMLGLALASPWDRLLTGGSVQSMSVERAAAGTIDLVLAGVLVWLLVRRHARVPVYAAAAYLLAASTAAFLGSLLFDPLNPSPFGGEWGSVLIVALPLVLLALPAAVAAFGPHPAVGQTVGAVALAAAGFLPMKVLVGEFATGPGGYAMQASLGPLTPTDQLGASTTLREVTGPALVAVIVLVLLAFVLAASLARRPSAPLAAAVTLLLLSAVQASLLTALSQWSANEAETLGWTLGAVALLAALAATILALVAARQHRSEPT